ncbi:MAG: hypothetical protein ACREOS_04145 [Candidatus Dormibacteraceae bacterium]
MIHATNAPHDFATPVLELGGHFADELSTTVGDGDLTPHRMAIQDGVKGVRDTLAAAGREVDQLHRNETLDATYRTKAIGEAIDKAKATITGHVEASEKGLSGLKSALEAKVMPTFTGSPADEGLVRHEIERLVDKSADPAATMLELARNPRYAGIVSGPAGPALMAGSLDPAFHEQVRAVALHEAAHNGSPSQQAAARQLSALLTGRKAIDSVRQGSHLALDQLQSRRGGAGVEIRP